MTTGGGCVLKEVLPDGSIVTVSRLWTEHRDASGVLLAAREPNADELAELDAREAAQGGLDVWGPVEQAERAVEAVIANHREEIRAAGDRLRQISTQATALAEADPLPTGTAAQVQAAVLTLDDRQRQIGAALADVADALRILGRIVLRDAT